LRRHAVAVFATRQILCVGDGPSRKQKRRQKIYNHQYHKILCGDKASNNQHRVYQEASARQKVYHNDVPVGRYGTLAFLHRNVDGMIGHVCTNANVEKCEQRYHKDPYVTNKHLCF
jgi:hypothetical protein